MTLHDFLWQLGQLGLIFLISTCIIALFALLMLLIGPGLVFSLDLLIGRPLMTREEIGRFNWLYRITKRFRSLPDATRWRLAMWIHVTIIPVAFGANVAYSLVKKDVVNSTLSAGVILMACCVAVYARILGRKKI